jgi:hypothetical protein
MLGPMTLFHLVPLQFLLQLDNPAFVNLNDFIKLLTPLPDLVDHLLYLHVARRPLLGLKGLEQFLVLWQFLYSVQVVDWFGVVGHLDVQQVEERLDGLGNWEELEMLLLGLFLFLSGCLCLLL